MKVNNKASKTQINANQPSDNSSNELWTALSNEQQEQIQGGWWSQISPELRAMMAKYATA